MGSPLHGETVQMGLAISLREGEQGRGPGAFVVRSPSSYPLRSGQVSFLERINQGVPSAASVGARGRPELAALPAKSAVFSLGDLSACLAWLVGPRTARKSRIETRRLPISACHEEVRKQRGCVASPGPDMEVQGSPFAGDNALGGLKEAVEPLGCGFSPEPQPSEGETSLVELWNGHSIQTGLLMMLRSANSACRRCCTTLTTPE